MKRFSILAIVFAFGISALITSCGNNGEDTDKSSDETVTKADDSAKDNTEKAEVADYSAGETIYKSKCMACHQENGEGVDPSFPALKGVVVDVKTVVNGKEGTAMAAFKNQLSDQELVDVINYVNHAWGNNAQDIKIEDITEAKN
jgi:cytochrome c oxidase subunit II